MSEPVTDDAKGYEVVNGERVKLPPKSSREVRIASRLVIRMGGHAIENDLGMVDSEMLFDLGAGLTQRRPDVAFVSAQRWPLDRQVPATNAWEVVPELVVEIIGATDLEQELMDKVEEYFAAGVKRVWVAYPKSRRVYEYPSPDSVHMIPPEGELDGGDLIPGFRMSLSVLFGPKAAQA